MEDVSYKKPFFHLWVLIPFWTIQWLLEVTVVVCAAIYISPFSTRNEFMPVQWEEALTGTVYSLIALAIIFMGLRIIQVVLFRRNRLSPAGYFAIELSQFILWTAVLSLAHVYVSYAYDQNKMLIMSSVLLGLYLGSFIYSCVIFDQYLKWKKSTKAQKVRSESIDSDRSLSVIQPTSRTSDTTAKDTELELNNTARDVEAESMLPAYEDVVGMAQRPDEKKDKHKHYKDDVKVGYDYD